MRRGVKDRAARPGRRARPAARPPRKRCSREWRAAAAPRPAQGSPASPGGRRARLTRPTRQNSLGGLLVAARRKQGDGRQRLGQPAGARRRRRRAAPRALACAPKMRACPTPRATGGTGEAAVRTRAHTHVPAGLPTPRCRQCASSGPSRPPAPPSTPARASPRSARRLGLGVRTSASVGGGRRGRAQRSAAQCGGWEGRCPMLLRQKQNLRHQMTRNLIP